jgi:hypothetical protein
MPKLVVSHVDPIVIVRADVLPVPGNNRKNSLHAFKAHGNDFLHGAYAIDGDDIVALDTLEYDTMDKNEFRASLESMAFALSQHYPLLSKFLAKKED